MSAPYRPMEVGWLEDFLALVDSGSFSRAADVRHLTQPAFSRRIRALEDWVGAPLFDRSGHPITLTEAGRRFRPAADEVMRRLQQGREEAREAEAAGAATLRFAATHSLSLTFFPEWMRAFEAKRRPSAVRLDSDSMRACEQLLASGQAQFLLCHHQAAVAERLNPKQFLSVRVGEDVLVPVSAPDAAGAPRFVLPGRPEEPLAYLAYAEASGLGRIVGAALSMREVWLERMFVSHLAVLLRTMALEGQGVAWMPRSLIANDLAQGELVPAGDHSWSIPVEIRLFRPRTRLSPAAEEFWSLTR